MERKEIHYDTQMEMDYSDLDQDLRSILTPENGLRLHGNQDLKTTSVMGQELLERKHDSMLVNQRGGNQYFCRSTPNAHMVEQQFYQKQWNPYTDLECTDHSKQTSS